MAAILFGIDITLYKFSLDNKNYTINLCYKIDKFSMIAISSVAALSLLTIFAQIGGNRIDCCPTTLIDVHTRAKVPLSLEKLIV